MRNLVHIFDGETGLRKAEFDCIDREVARMFLSAEPLLSRRRNYLPIDKKGSGRIMALRDTVLTNVQIRPMFLLERNRSFQTADSENFHGCPYFTLRKR